jgi:hypothetical protein
MMTMMIMMTNGDNLNAACRAEGEWKHVLSKSAPGKLVHVACTEQDWCWYTRFGAPGTCPWLKHLVGCNTFLAAAQSACHTAGSGRGPHPLWWMLSDGVGDLVVRNSMKLGSVLEKRGGGVW